MKILTVYVGQGELAVVRHKKEAVVVDSCFPKEHRTSITSQVQKFLKNQNVVGLVLTGFDDDHADPLGIAFFLNVYNPNWIMYPKYYKETKNANRVFKIIRAYEQKRKRSGYPIKKISVRLDLDLRRINKLSQHFSYELFSPHIEDMDNSNNCSIVLKLTGLGIDGFSYLITGDTENSRWDTITRLFGNRLQSDVLSAPHHGSKNAAHLKMAQLVYPDTVLISAGVNNQYGHPDPRAVNLYRCVANHVFMTNIEDGVSLLTKLQGNKIITQCVKLRSDLRRIKYGI